MRSPVGLSMRLAGVTLLLVGFWLPEASGASSKQPKQVTKTKQRYKEPPSQAKRHSSLQSLYKQACPGLVRIVCGTDEGADQTGSGFFVSKTGLVATNWSVIRNPDLADIRIETGGRLQLKANVLAIDREADLAILKPASPITVPHVFSGRSIEDAKAGKAATAPQPTKDVKVGEAVITIGYPIALRLSFSTGVVSGIRSAAEVREALEEKFSLRHKYRYLQTDAYVHHGNSGGPLLDEQGRVLGIITIGIAESRIGFALEWQAVADLLKKAGGARPMTLATLRLHSAAEHEQQRPTCFRLPATARQVALAAEHAKPSIYCGKCHGSGLITVDVKTKKRIRRKFLVTGPGIKPHYRYKWVTVTETEKVPDICTLCQGRGISPQAAESYKRLCDLVRTMYRLDETDGQVAFARRKGLQTLGESVFDDVWYATRLTEHARETLGAPQKHLGSPVIFIGKLHAVSVARDVSHLLVVIYGTDRPVYVWCPGSITALQGQWCQVAGTIGGLVENAPLVMAVDVSGLQVNPKLKPLESSGPKRR